HHSSEFWVGQPSQPPVGAGKLLRRYLPPPPPPNFGDAILVYRPDARAPVYGETRKRAAPGGIPLQCATSVLGRAQWPITRQRIPTVTPFPGGCSPRQPSPSSQGL